MKGMLSKERARAARADIAGQPTRWQTGAGAKERVGQRVKTPSGELRNTCYVYGRSGYSKGRGTTKPSGR